ncbi:hypothetical protein DOJK_00664 [Patescibacteria group bacterium]|nr:hypothetical protein DOJK_00664 [Patescibacteria group bacterium]
MSNHYQIEALKLLIAESVVIRSKFTAKQQRYLDDLVNQTGLIKLEKQGKGFIYRIDKESALIAYLKQLQPVDVSELNNDLPLRSQNIALFKNSKQGVTNHSVYYLLIKAIGDDVIWFNHEHSINISQQNYIQGVSSLMIEPTDDWQTDNDVLFVENMALFNRLDWLPNHFKGSIIYYAGNIPDILLSWLSYKIRAKRLLLFADYDGVGFNNFLRLYKTVSYHQSCEFYLMPNWQDKLYLFGNAAIWQNNIEKFHNAVQGLTEIGALNEELIALIRLMQSLGKGLEQEAIWC